MYKVELFDDVKFLDCENNVLLTRYKFTRRVHPLLITNKAHSLEEAIAFFSQESPLLASVFPLVITCPVCRKRLRSTRAGRFRCSGCKSIIAINDKGEVTLG